MSTRSLGVARARFTRDAAIRGEPITLNYAGNWTRNPATGVVSAASVSPSTANVNGFLNVGVLPSPFFDERLKKWGSTFSSNGAVLLPISTPIANLTSVVSLRSGDAYSVIVAAPDELSDGVFRTLLLRRGPIYNKVVSVAVQSQRDDGQSVLFTNLPCRISFPPASLQAGLAQVESAGIMAAAKPSLECPFIFEGAGSAGTGIQTAIPQGSIWTLDPKITVVKDDPSVYSSAGLTVNYRITSLNMDPGGDMHHQRYILGIAKS